jgi:hypothetical protein
MPVNLQRERTNPQLASTKFVRKKLLKKDAEIAAKRRKNAAQSLP